jgi:hypothetical protein
MKTSLIITVDTDNQIPISITKPAETEPAPTNADEAKAMINKDILCLQEALCFLIDAAHDNGYADRNELVNQTVIRLNKSLKD